MIHSIPLRKSFVSLINDVWTSFTYSAWTPIVGEPYLLNLQQTDAESH
jgi:hypothetical protein